MKEYTYKTLLAVAAGPWHCWRPIPTSNLQLPTHVHVLLALRALSHSACTCVRVRACKCKCLWPSTASGSRLLINGKISTSPDDIIAAWSTHFKCLSKSSVSESQTLQHLQSQTDHHHRCSMTNEDFVFDVPILAEEIEGVIKRLKRGKFCGPDGIFPEHILNLWWHTSHNVAQKDF